MNVTIQHPKLRRQAFTLVELLIVIAIMLVMVGVAIPTIRTLTKGDTVREAAREVNLFIESARSDAISKGFGGIWIKREDSVNRCVRLFKIKRSQRYTGDFENVEGYLESTTNPNQFSLYLEESENVLCALTNGIRPNDRIQFENRGPWYTIINPTNLDPYPESGVNHPVKTEPITGNPIPCYRLTFSTDGYPLPFEGFVEFRIDRFPTISNRDSIQLPKDSFINLGDSGFAAQLNTTTNLFEGGDEFFSNNQAGIMISFRADGSIDRVVSDGVSVVPPTSIYLHVCAESEDLQSDPLFNLENQWISISRTDGIVSTSSADTADGADRIEQRSSSRRGIRLGQTRNAN